MRRNSELNRAEAEQQTIAYMGGHASLARSPERDRKVGGVQILDPVM